MSTLKNRDDILVGSSNAELAGQFGFAYDLIAVFN